MGIPSYFKRLTDSVKGIILQKLDISNNAAALLIDFNCIVYNCLRSEKMPAYTEENESAWENKLIEIVCEEVVNLWKAAGSPASVFIAVDGVVPMAKVKQQRMRRFKSVWWAEKEREMGVRKVGEARWDTNSITPGTAFMEKLGTALQKLCSARKWTVSTSDEPGEGEHKIMKWIREGGVKKDGNVVIYGLDADLILLTCLTSELYLNEKSNPCFLMRERGEFGSVQALGEYLFLSIGALLANFTRTEENRKQFLLDYICCMSLLGNDFLPHAIHFKIKDGGHDRLLQLLHDFHIQKKYVVNNEKLDIENLKMFIAELAKTEEDDFLHAIEKKKKIRPMNPRNDVERMMSPVQNLPLEWFEEKTFLGDDWKEVYHSIVPASAVHEYVFGIQWIFDYYLGKRVNTFWFYPWHLPPLWEDIVHTKNFEEISLENDDIPLKPVEQLALVLPLESWHLIQNSKLRAMPILLPQFYPKRFGFVSLGKYWMWECEANIPIMTPGRLRSVVKI